MIEERDPYRRNVPRWISLEIGYGKQGMPSFVAHRPFFDWGRVRWVMMALHRPRKATSP